MILRIKIAPFGTSIREITANIFANPAHLEIYFWYIKIFIVCQHMPTVIGGSQKNNNF